MASAITRTPATERRERKLRATHPRACSSMADALCGSRMHDQVPLSKWGRLCGQTLRLVRTPRPDQCAGEKTSAATDTTQLKVADLDMDVLKRTAKRAQQLIELQLPKSAGRPSPSERGGRPFQCGKHGQASHALLRISNILNIFYYIMLY